MDYEIEGLTCSKDDFYLTARPVVDTCPERSVAATQAFEINVDLNDDDDAEFPDFIDEITPNIRLSKFSNSLLFNVQVSFFL